MEKCDLKTGMVVEYSDGTKAVVQKDADFVMYGHQDIYFADKKGFMIGNLYNEEFLRTSGNKEWDIIGVYMGNNNPFRALDKPGKLLWQREESKQTYTNLIFCKHDNDNRKFLFKLPNDTQIKSGTMLFADTMHGSTKVMAVTDSFIVDESNLNSIVSGCGAYLPLKNIIGFAKEIPASYECVEIK